MTGPKYNAVYSRLSGRLGQVVCAPLAIGLAFQQTLRYRLTETADQTKPPKEGVESSSKVKGATVLTNLQPQALSQEEGSAFWFLNNLITVKATTESTGGSYSLCHQVSPPGSATPYHLHHFEDEAFYVLEGESTFICDGKKTIAGPGEYLFLPRGNSAWHLRHRL